MIKLHAQPGILAPIPAQGCYLSFLLADLAQVPGCLSALQVHADGSALVVGCGASLAIALGRDIQGLTSLVCQSHAGIDIPASPAALWCWLRGDDRGELLLRARVVTQCLAPAFVLESSVDAFRYAGDLDLSGYEDGTENPVGDNALVAALVSGQGAGLDGASFVAVQQWQHDFDALERMSAHAQDLMMGRRKADNEEIDDAPLSAHVKRTAQESFTPEAFLLRRSMPWADTRHSGLHFVAFGHSFAAFEAQLQRMLGLEDGVVDAIFSFSRPRAGAYFWCPPLRDGALDWSALGC